MLSMSYWDPFVSRRSFDPSFAHLRRHFERAFEELETGAPNAPRAPEAALRETAEGYEFSLEVPGLSHDDVSLEVHGQVLSVRAERNTEPSEGFTAHRLERPSFRMAQSFTLPSRLDVDNVQAQLEDGVLTVTLPKAREERARAITIKAGAQN